MRDIIRDIIGNADTARRSADRLDQDVSEFLHRLERKYGVEYDTQAPDDIIDLIERLSLLKQRHAASSKLRRERPRPI